MKKLLKTPPIWVLIGILITSFGLFFAFIPRVMHFNHYSHHWAEFPNEENPNTHNFFIPSLTELEYLFSEHTIYALCVTAILLWLFILIWIKAYSEHREEFWIGLITIGTVSLIYIIIPSISLLKEIDLSRYKTEDSILVLVVILAFVILFFTVKYHLREKRENRWQKNYKFPTDKKK